jgi:hypothetical protein
MYQNLMMNLVWDHDTDQHQKWVQIHEDCL